MIWHPRIFIVALAALVMFGASAFADDTFTVQLLPVVDQKAVFATVESANVIPARVRTGGTISSLSVHPGDKVAQGQVLANVGDQKLALQTASIDADIAALQDTYDRAQSEVARVETLARASSGAISATHLDDVRTAAKVAANNLKARRASKSVLQQTMSEGDVVAPVAGRILSVPVTAGTVVMAGESVAVIAEENFVLRLEMPERHARYIKAGDSIELLAAENGLPAPRSGKVTLVYPQVKDGRVIADATVAGLGDYFVGERLRVNISAGERQAFVIPEKFIVSRSGVDYVRVRGKEGPVEVVVQTGQTVTPGNVEILSGVRDGDILVQP